MPIRPLDIVKTQEVSQIKHMENQKAQQAQEQIGRSFQNMVQIDQHKPTQMTKSDNNEYRYDAKDKSNNQYKGSGNKKNQKDNEEKKNETHKNSGIDILI